MQTRISPATLQRWRDYRDKRITEGVTHWAVARELAGEYAVSTIYLHVHEAFRDRLNAARRAQYRLGNSRSEPLKTDHQSRYRRNYSRVTRNPVRFLAAIFADRDEADLQTITHETRGLAEGVNFQPATIRRILDDFATGQRDGRIRGPPFLQEIRPLVWAYSNERVPR